MLVAPRIVNDVSYVRDINHEKCRGGVFFNLMLLG